ncbi:MAG: hypothetical protein IPO81_26270 [Kouleothrix sp.]|nr:hypothetical protein [Kouleothrix sp.]
MRQQQIIRWIIGAAVAATLALGGIFGSIPPSTAYGADPTPTPAQTNSEPGGSSGGGH